MTGQLRVSAQWQCHWVWVGTLALLLSDGMLLMRSSSYPKHVVWACGTFLAVSVLPVPTLVCVRLALQAFWVPSQAPEAKDLLAKPDSATYCPASSKKLRLKDCVAVKFTPVSKPQGL